MQTLAWPWLLEDFPLLTSGNLLRAELCQFSVLSHRAFLSCSLLFTQHPVQCLTNRKHSVNFCWMKKWVWHIHLPTNKTILLDMIDFLLLVFIISNGRSGCYCDGDYVDGDGNDVNHESPLEQHWILTTTSLKSSPSLTSRIPHSTENVFSGRIVWLLFSLQEP